MTDDTSRPSSEGLGLHALRRRFGTHVALRDVDASLPAGLITTVFGPNGAGKSTLLRILAGSLRPTAGSVSWRGEKLDPRSADWRSRIGVLSHATHLYAPLGARENLAFHARMHGLEAPDLDAALERVDLLSRAEDRVSGFSRGMRQRLALARTLLHDPDVVLLDEPFTGLDSHAARLLEGVLRTLRDGRRTVVLVTHALGEGLALADHVLLLVRGSVRLDAPASDFEVDGFAERYHGIVDAAETGLAATASGSPA
ncbi:MAG TPA: ABC transporter ATP-binding protein [Longimicrobiales bacterium]|nr:ABC transporter ATP-binding protein [Longimicrobiales bacterium]